MNDVSSSDELPRLPPAVHRPLDGTSGDAWSTIRTPGDLGAVDQNRASIRRMSWAEYEEPELLPIRHAGRAVIGARIVLAVWAVSLVVVAAVLRDTVADGFASTTRVAHLGSLGLLLAIGATVVGWYWSDRTTQNVHRLEARLPSRFRCASGWAWPLVWFAIVSFTILRLDATELVDVRPAIAALLLALALWRPYALVRRILKSLIRVDSDLAIASAYLLDLALFGLVWARLASLPDDLGPSDGGVVGVLLGLSAVAAIAAIANVGVWWVVVRDVSRAVDHRRVAMRTRHEHRQLRLVGIDPLDPKVRLALFMIRQEDHRAEVERTRDDADARGGDEHRRDGAASSGRDVGGHATASVPEADGVRPVAGDRVEDERTEPAQPPPAADDEVWIGDDAPIPVAASGDAEPSIGGERAVEVVPSPDEVIANGAPPMEGADAGPPPVGREPLDHLAARLRTDRRGADARPPARHAERDGERTVAPDRPSLAGAAGAAGSTGAGPPDGAEARPRGSHDRLAARAEAARSDTPEDPLDRLSGPLHGASTAGGGASPEGPRGRLSGRLGAESFADDGGRSMLARLERLGIAPGDRSIPDDGTSRLQDEPAEPTVLTIERVYSLELARYLLVLAAVGCALVSGWFVVRSVDVGELVDGQISQASIDRMEVARLAAVTMLVVVLALVPAWCAVAARWANRVADDVPGSIRCAALTVVSFGFVAAGIVADPASNVMLPATIGCLGAALWSVPVMITIERRFGRGTTIPSLLPLTLALGVLVAWAGRLLRPVAATDSPEATSFFGGLLALVMAIAAAVTAVSTGDVVEAIKLSPAAPGRARAASADDR